MAATKAAQKRLTREYKAISENPPPYIVAHPSESNILEWHYILTGPEKTPYHNGQYWGTLVFPPNYPFAPPAIRMHTPSGRFQPSTRLCLSISDFHPKSFNPAWEVSTILIGLLSFMTSDELTTGSISASDQERRFLAGRSRWWNSTGGGSHSRPGGAAARGNVKAGDGGAKFRQEWADADRENWDWIRENNVDVATGQRAPVAGGGGAAAQTTAGAKDGGPLAAPTGDRHGDGGAQPAEIAAADPMGLRNGHATERRSWMRRNSLALVGATIFLYVLIVRILGVESI